MADNDQTGTDEPTVAELADRQAATDSKVDELLGIVKNAIGTGGTAHADAQKITESRLDQDSSVAAQVQAELDRRDQAARDAEKDTDLATLKTTVAELREQPPAAPVRRIEKIMGWHG
jgi:hypothetical protein